MATNPQYLATLYSASGAIAVKSMGPFSTLEQAQAAAAKLVVSKLRKVTDFVAVETTAGVCISREQHGGATVTTNYGRPAAPAPRGPFCGKCRQGLDACACAFRKVPPMERR